MKETPSLILHRLVPYPHMELHYSDRVEFWDYNDKKIGESKVTEVASS